VLSDGVGLYLAASTISGFIASAASNPFDFAKSRVMASNNRYKSMLHCMSVSVRDEGVRVLWSGFSATFVRLCPNIVITFVVMESLKKKFDST